MNCSLFPAPDSASMTICIRRAEIIFSLKSVK